MPTRSSSLSTILLAAGAALGLGACSDALTGPGGELSLSQDITVNELTQQLGEGVRVELSLYEGELVAREVEIRRVGEREDEEYVLSNITAIDGTAGVLTLGLGIEVGFHGETDFRGHEAEFGLADFVARVTEALTAGRPIYARAERAPRALPQDPDDREFTAARIRLNDDAGHKLSLDVSRANLQINDTPPPDAVLTLLGVAVELRVTDGRTRLRGPDDRREVDFAGRVHEVDVREGLVILIKGDDRIRVQIVDETRMGFGDDPIETLAPVARALEAGLVVHARGHGVLRNADRHIIVAHVIRFMADDERDQVGFHGKVHEVGVREGLVVLRTEDGHLHVKITDATRMALGDREIESLEPIARALEAGLTVHARGEGVVINADRVVIQAHVIHFAIAEPHDEVAFAGAVRDADAVAGLFVLADDRETVVKVGNDTRMAIGDRVIESLEPIVAALEAGHAVHARGEGVVVNADRSVILAHVVRFEIDEGTGGGE